MQIGDIVDRAMRQATAGLSTNSLDLRSIIYLAVQTGMADAYERGFASGKEVGADLTADEIAQRDAGADI